ncbi:hypothetical protein V6N11_080495 [Hibiscus sabdariffa]|uniref:Uncharacterized protein n=1 Tax=Hibiscus sabdariffa TaxID=183260 RepID=A0ABR2R874_9ROSI
MRRGWDPQQGESVDPELSPLSLTVNCYCCSRENTVLGDIQFVPNDACIVDLRIGLPNEVPGLFWSFNFHPGQTILSSTGSCGSSYRAFSSLLSSHSKGYNITYNRKMVPPLTRKSGISIAIVGQCEVDTPTVQSIDRYRCRCSHSISSPFGSESLYLDNGIGTTERFVLVGAAVQEVF